MAVQLKEQPTSLVPLKQKTALTGSVKQSVPFFNALICFYHSRAILPLLASGPQEHVLKRPGQHCHTFRAGPYPMAVPYLMAAC